MALRDPLIETIGFVTRDRPVMLRRAVASAFVHARVHDRAPHLLVVDDSTDRHATLDALRSLRVDVSYVGRDEKVAFLMKKIDRRSMKRITRRVAGKPGTGVDEYHSVRPYRIWS